MGAVKLEILNAHTIQKFYNSLSVERDGKPGLSPKSVKIIHGVLHKALQQAVANGYLRANPADACTLPKMERKEMHVMDEDATGRFIAAVKGHRYERVFLVTLFTGMRQGEVLALTWDCVDFQRGTVIINKQLQKDTGGGSVYHLISTKNGKGRKITPAPFVMDLLRDQWAVQDGWKVHAGAAWEDWEDAGLVFTDELDGPVMPHTLYHNFKKIAVSIGLPGLRYHDMRHSYAVAAIRAGDDIKTVSGNLGHATTSFTLDVYGHVTDQMQQASAQRMEKYIEGVKNL